ncbi:MAG: hypothetical protein DI596_15710 [Azospira oryzae]|nr:MAG: hypothetical protein DI596_15710 [Azospira oryzae]PZP74060.1 MAG: hypothetical protein DI593_15710 [Azospira oryzae]
MYFLGYRPPSRSARQGAGMMRYALFPAVLALWAGPVFADLYKCIDAHGRVQYTDQPAAACLQKGAKVKVPSTTLPAATAPKSLQEQELEFRKRRAEQTEAEAQAQKEAQLRAQNCEAARANLAVFTQGGRVIRYNAQGEREYLSDEQRAQEIEKWQKEVAQWCGT